MPDFASTCCSQRHSGSRICGGEGGPLGKARMVQGGSQSAPQLLVPTTLERMRFGKCELLAHVRLHTYVCWGTSG